MPLFLFTGQAGARWRSRIHWATTDRDRLRGHSTAPATHLDRIGRRNRCARLRRRRLDTAAQDGGSPSDDLTMTASGFRFRLERVRALRERREEIAKQELASAIGRLMQSERQLSEVNDRLAAAHAGQRDSATAKRMSSADLIARQAFVERVEQQRQHGARELVRSESEVASRGAAFSLAAQEHQMLQRLKDRHQAEHSREVSRREGQALDEIALDRFRRNVA